MGSGKTGADDCIASRASYREDLETAATQGLNRAHGQLKDTLYGRGNATDELHLTADASLNEEIAKMNEAKHVKPIGREEITFTKKGPDGASQVTEYTLDAAFKRFKADVQAHEKLMLELAQKHEAIVNEIAQFVAEKLEARADIDDIPALDAKAAEIVEELGQEINALGANQLEDLETEIRTEKEKMRQLQELMDQLMLRNMLCSGGAPDLSKHGYTAAILATMIAKLIYGRI